MIERLLKNPLIKFCMNFASSNALSLCLHRCGFAKPAPSSLKRLPSPAARAAELNLAKG
jgi:hypothetical protein